MKLFALLLFTIGLSSLYKAQNIEDNVLEIYGKDQCEYIQKTNPSQLEILNAYSKVGFVLIEKEGKNEKYSSIDKIQTFIKGEDISITYFLRITENKDFNPLYFVWRPSAIRQVYHLANTNFFVIIPSQKQIKTTL
jgi:hypothetical protein